MARMISLTPGADDVAVGVATLHRALIPSRLLQLWHYVQLWRPVQQSDVVKSVGDAYASGLPVTYIRAILVVAHEQSHLSTSVFEAASRELGILSRQTQSTNDAIVVLCGLMLLFLAIAIALALCLFEKSAQHREELLAQREAERTTLDKLRLRRGHDRVRRREQEKKRFKAEGDSMARELLHEETTNAAGRGDEQALSELGLPDLMLLERETLSALARIQTHRERRREEEEAQLTCIVCMHSIRQVVFLPCTHFITCVACSERVSSCPKCRSPIDQRLTTFR